MVDVLLAGLRQSGRHCDGVGDAMLLSLQKARIFESITQISSAQCQAHTAGTAATARINRTDSIAQEARGYIRPQCFHSYTYAVSIVLYIMMSSSYDLALRSNSVTSSLSHIYSIHCTTDST